jgi:hypothetical protein
MPSPDPMKELRRETLLALARVYRKHARAQIRVAAQLRDPSLRNSVHDVSSVMLAVEQAIVSAANGYPLPLEELGALSAGFLAAQVITLPDDQ